MISQINSVCLASSNLGNVRHINKLALPQINSVIYLFGIWNLKRPLMHTPHCMDNLKCTASIVKILRWYLLCDETPFIISGLRLKEAKRRGKRHQGPQVHEKPLTITRTLHWYTGNAVINPLRSDSCMGKLRIITITVNHKPAPRSLCIGKLTLKVAT